MKHKQVSLSITSSTCMPPPQKQHSHRYLLASKAIRFHCGNSLYSITSCTSWTVSGHSLRLLTWLFLTVAHSGTHCRRWMSGHPLSVFRQRLKTFLFHKSFPDVVWQADYAFVDLVMAYCYFSHVNNFLIDWLIDWLIERQYQVSTCYRLKLRTSDIPSTRFDKNSQQS